jgi:hypothetical protein
MLRYTFCPHVRSHLLLDDKMIAVGQFRTIGKNVCNFFARFHDRLSFLFQNVVMKRICDRQTFFRQRSDAEREILFANVKARNLDHFIIFENSL